MSASHPSVSIVICTYSGSRWHHLETAVRSLQSQSMLPSQVIVVVDHNPELLARVRDSFTDLVAVHNWELRGLSGARNAGVRVATGDVVAFLDDDAEADTAWLETLVSRYSDDKVLGVGGTVRPVWEAARPAWFPSEFDWVIGCTYLGLPTTTSAIRNLIGCNMSFRRGPVLAVGGFQIGRVGQLAVGHENDETELCIRLHQSWPETRIVYEPNAVIHHSVPRQRGSWSYFCIRCWSEGLSKSLLARRVGRQRALASETTYARRTLPSGFLRGITDCVLRRDPSGLLRAMAITTGLCLTTAGYLAGRLRIRHSSPNADHSGAGRNRDVPMYSRRYGVGIALHQDDGHPGDDA